MATGVELDYGGYTLTMVQTQSYRREAVLNGPDFMYVRHELHVVGVLNLKTVVGIGPSVPFTPQEIDFRIREYFMTPRRSFKYTIQGTASNTGTPTEWFNISPPTLGQVSGANQPAVYFDTDNGPLPLYCQVNIVGGTGSAIIAWGVSWCVKESDQGSKNQPSPLVSNRWVMSHIFDRNQWMEIHVKGRAVFRTDSLQALPRYADEYRSWFLLPVLDGFTRMNLVVTEAQDTSAIEYSFVDRQNVLAPANPNIAYIDLTQDFITMKRGLDENLEEHFNNIAGAKAQDPKVPTAAMPKGKLGWAGWAKLGLGVAKANYHALARTNILVKCTVYGTPAATLTNLVETWLTVVQNRLAKLTTFNAGSTGVVSIDYINNLVSGYLEIRTNPLLFMFCNEGETMSNIPEPAIKNTVANYTIPNTLIEGQGKEPLNNTGAAANLLSPLPMLFTAVLNNGGKPPQADWPATAFNLPNDTP